MKTFVQRWLVIFAAFVVAAIVVLSGCADAVVGHDEVNATSSRYSQSSNAPVHNRPVSTALIEPSQALNGTSRLVQAREETQRARRLISRW